MSLFGILPSDAFSCSGYTPRMAVNKKPTTEAEWMEAQYAPYVEKQLPCFYCNKPLHYPVVGWDGHGKDGKLLEIVMHPRCANDLILRLAPDVVRAG